MSDTYGQREHLGDVHRRRRTQDIVEGKRMPTTRPGGFQDTVGEWGERTFPDSTPKSIMAHLQEEVEELRRPVHRDHYMTVPDDAEIREMTRNHIAEEAADCYLLLLHLAHRFGFNLEQAAQAKHVVNLGRHWHDGGRGYAKHVETER